MSKVTPPPPPLPAHTPPCKAHTGPAVASVLHSRGSLPTALLLMQSALVIVFAAALFYTDHVDRAVRTPPEDAGLLACCDMSIHAHVPDHGTNRAKTVTCSNHSVQTPASIEGLLFGGVTLLASYCYCYNFARQDEGPS